jgi:hypothetical protein|nr:MAG TPA: hypothetical protein [Caudoviricetes sp.]
MIDTSIKVKMVTLDDLKDLESAPDEKAFYKVIKDSWKLTNATDGLYLENIDYTAEGLSEEDLAAFLGVDISAYGDDSEERAALQNDLSDAYQMREDEVDARVCWLARDEIISEAREVFEESHLYTKEDDTEHLHYIKLATYEEMATNDVDTSKAARLKLSEAIKSLAVQRVGTDGFDTSTEALDAIKLVSKYTEEEVYDAARRSRDEEAIGFMEYVGTKGLNLYTTDWGDELRQIISETLEDCECTTEIQYIHRGREKLNSFIDLLKSDDFERIYNKDDLAKDYIDTNAAIVLGGAINSFIDWAKEQEQDNTTLQSLKTRLAENSALAFDKDFRASLAEEVQKLIK